MQLPGVHIETVLAPVLYTNAQIEEAAAIAHFLGRGKLVLTMPPRRA